MIHLLNVLSFLPFLAVIPFWRARNRAYAEELACRKTSDWVGCVSAKKTADRCDMNTRLATIGSIVAAAMVWVLVQYFIACHK